MKKIIYLMLLIPSLSFAQLTIDLSTGTLSEKTENQQNEPSSSSSDQQTYEYNFRAEDYFATRYEGSYVDPTWPEQVTLIPVEMSLEDFERYIHGRWKVMYTCGGRPLFSEEVLSVNRIAFDGYLKPRAVFEFNTDDDVFRRYFATPIKAVNSGVLNEEILQKETHREFSMRDGRIFHSDSFFFEMEYKVSEIEETGERVILGGEWQGRCSNGSPLEGILVNIDSVPLS